MDKDHIADEADCHDAAISPEPTLCMLTILHIKIKYMYICMQLSR